MSIIIPSLRAAVAVPGWAKNELWRKARAVPSLDLRFTDSKSLVDATTGQSLVTFTRASDGTFVGSDGVLQTAVTNAPRFDHNPTTGESLGLLVEEARTNLVLRSEEFDNASWSQTGLKAFGSGSVANAIAAPNGSVTADFLVDNTSTGEHFTNQIFTAVSGTSYTFSVFIKPSANKTGVMLRYTSTVFGGITNQIQVVFATGAVTALTGTPTGTATPLPNGWWRISITATATANGTPQARVQFYSNNGTSSTYTGDGTSGYYLWGAQLETGAFPTSYIPTTTAAATRAADVASITGSAFSSWYRQDEGSICLSGAPRYAFGGINTFPRAFAISDGTTATMIDMRYRVLSSFSDSGYAVANGGVTQATYDSASNTAGQVMSMAYQANSFAFSIGGALPDSDTSGTVPTVDRMILGNIPGGTTTLNGTIRRLTYWPQRLANSTLQSITS